MERIEFHLLGGFECQYGGKVIGVTGTRKMRALLAFLALGVGQRHSRDKLATLLWGNSADRQAANSLNQAVYSIRKELPNGESVLCSDHEFVWLDPSRIESDVKRFEDEARSTEATALCASLFRYHGTLLDGLDLNEEPYNDWLRLERSRLENLAIGAGEHLLDLHGHEPDETSVQQARQLLTIDRSNETAHRHLMCHHARNGRTEAAMRQFEECRTALKQASDASPSEPTMQLANAIAAGSLQAALARDQISGRRRGKWPLATAAAIVLFLAAAVTLSAIRIVGQHDAGPGSMRLAIIPFETAGPNADPAIAHGLADDVTTELAFMSDLSVIDRESASRLAEEEPRTFVQHGVTHILRGRLRQSANEPELVLHLWLVEAASGSQIWAESFRGSRDDLATLQERSLVSVGAAMVQHLSREPREVASAASSNPVAYDHYLRGLTFQFEGTPDGHAEAAKSYQRALDLDPGFDKAKAAMAAIQFDLAFGPQAFAEAQETSWLDAYLHLKYLLAAINDDSPALAMVLESRLALRRRDYRAAIEFAKSAMAFAPGSAQAAETYAEVLIYNGNYDTGETHARRALALNPATPSRPIFLLALAAYGRGDIGNAIEHGKNAVDRAPHPHTEALGLLGAAFANDGRLETARRYLDAYANAHSDRPRHVWKIVNAEFTNPRETTWQRPTLASTVYSYPFADSVVLKRLAQGLSEAGIAGRTLGYLPASQNARLDGRQIAVLFFDATVRGRNINPGSSEEWMQFRSADGALVQIGDFGPLPLGRRGRSSTRDDQLCDQWDHEGQQVETCASVFKIFEGVGNSVAGTHFIAGEVGPFLISPIAK